MISAGSAQTNGLPLLVPSSATAAAPTLLHTCPVGSATPHRVQILASNPDAARSHRLNVQVCNSSGTVIETFSAVVESGATSFNVLDAHRLAGAASTGGELILNGTATIKVFGGEGQLYVTARVDDQGSVAGIVSQVFASGLVAAVQNASRYAVNAQGGTGQATVANAYIKMSRAYTLKNFRVSADAAVGTTAVVSVSVYINGADSGLLLTLANADGTTDKTLAAVTVAGSAGDLVAFHVACTNVAPAANIHATCDLV